MTQQAELMSKLLRDKLYAQALAAARTDEERAQIARFVEGFISSVAPVLDDMIAAVQQDPEAAARLNQALLEKQAVLSSGGSKP